MTEQKRNLIIGAVGLGAFLAAQAWRRKSNYDFAGKSVVITGGSRGLGLVMARELADHGARLTLVARSDEELDRAVDAVASRRPGFPVHVPPSLWPRRASRRGGDGSMAGLEGRGLCRTGRR